MANERSARERILHVTSDLIEQQGYHATGLNQIVRESAAPKGSLYHYFPDGKEEIAASAIADVSEKIVERLREQLSAIDDPAEAIRHVVLQIAQRVESMGCQRGAQTASVVLETAHRSERLRIVAMEAYDQRREVCRVKLISSGFDVEAASQLSSLIISAIEGAIILSRAYQSIEPLHHTAELLFRLIKSESERIS